MAAVFGVLYLLALLYFVVLIARLVLSYVQILSRDWTPRGPVLVLAEFVFSATDPPIRAVGRVVRPVRIGPVMLDLAFVIVFIGVIIAMNVFERLAS